MVQIGSLQLRHILLLIYTGLWCLAYIFPYKLWAFSTITLYPLWLQLIFWAFITVLTLPEILLQIDKFLTRSGNFLFVEYRKYAPYIIASISLVILLIAWNDHILLADSHSAISYVKQFPERVDFGHTRIFPIALYKIFCELLSLVVPYWRSISIFHIIAGSLFGIIILKISEVFTDSPKKRLAGVILMLSGSSFLIFNHIELYAPAILLVSITYLVLIQGLKAQSISYRFLIPAVIAFLFHPLMVYLIGYALVILLITKYKKQGWDIILFITLFIPIIIIHFGGFGLSQNILITNNLTYFFSSSHWLMTLNYILFSTPVILALIKRNSKTGHDSRISQVLLWGTGVSLTMTALLYFALGGADWDLLAMILFPIVLYCVYRMVQISDHVFLSFVVGVSAIFFLMNILVGISPDYEFRRAEQLLINQGVPYIEEQFPGLIRLAYFSKAQFIEFDDKKAEQFAKKYSLESIERYPRDDRGYLYLAQLYSHKGKNRLAEAALLYGFHHVEKPGRITVRLAELYQKRGQVTKALVLLATAPSLPDSVLVEWEKPDNRNLGDMVVLIKSALKILGIEDISFYMRGNSFYWLLYRGNAPIYVELVPVLNRVLLFIHSPIASVPTDSKNLLQISSFLLKENELAETGPAKFFIKDDIIELGTVRPLSYLEKGEVTHLIDNVSRLADYYNEFLARRFGCEIITYIPEE